MGSSTSKVTNKVVSPIKGKKTPIAIPAGAEILAGANSVVKPSGDNSWLDIASPSRGPIFHITDFEICYDRVLGEGSFAKVMLAKHIPTGKLCAVKVINKNAIPENMRPYVVREPRVLASLHHKNIVKLLLAHEDDNNIFVFEQLMDGGDLHTLVEQKDWLEEKEAKKIFTQIVAAVEYCHKNWVCHRDLKLENVLISSDTKRVMVIDFGFAGVMENGPVHRFTDFPGSVCYAAPELLAGMPYDGTKSDVYALGVLLYTMVNGRYPFYSENKQQMCNQVFKGELQFDDTITDDCVDLIRKMMHRSAEKRISVEEIAQHPWMESMPKQAPLSPVHLFNKATSLIDQVEEQLTPNSMRAKKKLLF